MEPTEIINENSDVEMPLTSIKETYQNSIKTKKFKTGIVYLSFIPPYMTADMLRRMLAKHAPLGRIFIQVVVEPGGRKKKKNKEDICHEGWVEFKKKRHAKNIAAMLNNTKMGGKKKSRFYDCLWNIKYLPRFKWVHLMERLSYEKAVMKQKLMAEISQAKRVANHFKETVEKEQYNKVLKRKGEFIESKINEETQHKQLSFKQKDSKEDKINKINNEEKREIFLKSLFS